jgi:hypothetical protein
LVPSPEFVLTYSVAAGVPGAPGKPGDGGLPGLQGCGGRGAAGCMSESIRRQGFPGKGYVAGLLGHSGDTGQKGELTRSGTFQAIEVGEDNQCAPIPGLDEPTKALIDKVQAYDFWAIVGRKMIGDSFRRVRAADGATAIIVSPDSSRQNNPFAFINLFTLNKYALKRPPLPLPPPAGCVGESCCVQSVWSGCLTAAQWQFATNENGRDRYTSRVKWRRMLLELLHVEAAKSTVIINSEQEEIVPEGGLVYIDYGFTAKQRVLLKLEEDLFTRLVLTVARLHSDLRVALDSDVPAALHTLHCSQGKLSRLATPDRTYDQDRSGRMVDRPGYSNLFVISKSPGIELNEPSPQKRIMVIPIGYNRSETFLGNVIEEDLGNIGRWPSRPGFREGGFCKMQSTSEPIAEDAPLACGASFAPLVEAIRQHWASFDSPTLITELHSIIYLNALVKSEGFAWSGDSDQTDLKLHCTADN